VPTAEQIRAAVEPLLAQGRGTLRSIECAADGRVEIAVALSPAGAAIQDELAKLVYKTAGSVAGVTDVALEFDELTPEPVAPPQSGVPGHPPLQDALAGVQNVICVGSGKGGVGKSTLTANLGAALAAEGKRTGVLDADVWGYSIPRMFGLGNERPQVSGERKILPPVVAGIKIMSIGFFLEEDAAVVWRGPMLHKALQQFLEDVAWGELDYLLVDLPPGTGDVSMSIAQFLPRARFLIVTTPQPTAQKVARRAAEMATKTDLELCGVIENMSHFTTPSGERFDIFGSGGGQELADELELPLLGQVPLTMPLRAQSDAGVPLVSVAPDDPAAVAIREAARSLIALSPIALPMMQVAPAGASGLSLPMA